MKRYACLFLAVLAGCGGREAEPERSGVAGTVAGEERSCRDGAYRAVGSAGGAWAAVVRDSARAYRQPGSGELARFGRLNVNGVPTVLGIVGEVVDAACEAGWYRVRLPIKPNGSVGWVRAADVDVESVRTRVVVDLSERRVTLFRDGKVYLRTSAVIGTRATPTPTGTYYVNQRLIPADTSGPFGPGAIGISAFSEVLTGWAQGGPIAIHGTNRPELIGRAASNGCIRVRNDVLLRMWRVTLSGTPVTIRA
jgi:hypothetical protein